MDFLNQSEIDEIVNDKETLAKTLETSSLKVEYLPTIKHNTARLLCDTHDYSLDDDDAICDEYAITITYDADSLLLGKLPNEIITALYTNHPPPQ